MSDHHPISPEVADAARKLFADLPASQRPTYISSVSEREAIEPPRELQNPLEANSRLQENETDIKLRKNTKITGHAR